MNTLRPLKVAVLLALLAGCSRVQLGYSQLDPHYLETYMEFSEQQQAVVDRRVDGLLKWHCSSQLGAYAELLRAANTDFRLGLMTRQRLEEYSDQLHLFWIEIMRRVSPGIADVLLTASDAQVKQLFATFNNKNEDWLADFRDQTEEQLRDVYEQRLTEELERWFGPLDPPQRQAVVEWGRRFKPLGLEGLEMRRRWQARLRELIDRRDNTEGFYAGVEQLFVDPGALRSPAVRQRFDRNRDASIDLLQRIGTRLSERQQRHLADETSSVANDLEGLVCRAEGAGPTLDKSDVSIFEPRVTLALMIFDFSRYRQRCLLVNNTKVQVVA